MTATTKPTVRMYMDRQTHAISPDEDILSALGRLIKEGVTGVPVIDAQGHLIGRLSEYECLRLLAEGQGGERPHGTVRDFMSTEFTSVPPTINIYYVAGMFLANPNHRRYAVVEGGQLVGVITRKDILKAVNLGLSGA